MNLKIEIHSDRRWSYANAGTRRPLVKSIHLIQDGSLLDADVNILPRVTLDFPLPESVADIWTARVPRTIESRGANVGDTISWDRIDLKLHYPLLGRLQEKVRGVVRVEIVNADTDEVLAVETQDLELLAPNEFRQEADYLEVIAAFVLPTDSYVSEILQVARGLLQQRTGSSATEGYQSDARPSESGSLEDTRAFQIAHAVYDAMSSMGYDYSNPQGYFDMGAQRVRTPSQIKQENCATCLDSSVLMAACLAQAGLEPVIFMIKGHAFAGYFTGRPFQVQGRVLSGDDAVNHWMRVLQANSLSQLVRSRDYAIIQELLRNRHILPIETTTTTRSMPMPFRDACQRQNNFSVDEDDSLLEGIVVVKLAWLDGITPPIVLNDKGTHTVEPWEVKAVEPTDGDSEYESIPLSDAQLGPEERAIPPRVRQWMASLLDLSSRNPLLKIKPSQMMEFHVPSSIMGSLDDVLHTSRKRVKLPAFSSLPYTWVHKGVTDDEFEQWSKRESSLVFPSYKEFNSLHHTVERELKKIKDKPDHPAHDLPEAELIKRLREMLLANSDSLLGKTAKKLLDKANDVMLMTGNNSLYLALGTVAWEETTDFRGKGKTTQWCAPLYLYPVILEGGKGRPWTLQLDPNGEVTPNFCLHEKLKRPPYNIDLQELVNPETDDKGIDLDKMITAVRRRLAQAKLDNVAVQPRAVLGVFDYATFRLWKDLRDDWKKMTEISPVFKHIAYTSNTPYVGNPSTPEHRLQPLLPIAADDSQREAVQLALDGQSFKLEGPPGTGKSQTITNLLASCIAHNLKVLFVAEKQTALNAVKSRLDAAGLGMFSLNLHAKGDSDSKLRKNISTALTTALNANIDPADNAWNEIQFRLSTEQAALDRYRASLHDGNDGSASTWDANEQLLELGDGPVVDLPADFVPNFESRWVALREASVALEQALDLVPSPSTHPWRFVGAVSLEKVDFSLLSRCLRALSDASESLRSAGGISADLRAAIDEGTLAAVTEGVRLQRDGLLPTRVMLSALASGAGAELLEAYGKDSDRFVVEARALFDLLAPHANSVSPSIVTRTDRDELRRLIDDVNSPQVQASLEELSRAWKLVAHEMTSLDISGGFRPIPSHLRSEVQREVDAAESVTDFAEFGRIVAQLRSLQAQLGEHQQNIAPHVVQRNDLADIEFRAKEASEAGVLVRGRKCKALRETLGADARASDDRLLVNSTLQVVRTAREIRDAMQSLGTRFPEVVVDGVHPWETTDLDVLATALLSARVSRLRAAGHLVTAPEDDRRFLDMIKVALAVSPTVEDIRRRALEVLPSIDMDSVRPWISDEFESFRHQVAVTRAGTVVRLLGDDARSADPTEVVIAAKVFLEAAERLTSMERTLRSVLFPDFTGTFRPWEKFDVDRIETAIHDALAFIGSADKASLSILVAGHGDTSTSSLAKLMVDAGVAWSELSRVIPTEDLTSWIGGRSLFGALTDELPGLVRDIGQNDNFLEFHRWQELKAACERIAELGLDRALPELLDRSVAPHEFLSRVRRSALTQSLRTRMEQGNLDRFDRKVHERRIATFEAALSDARKILNQRVPGLAASRRQARRLPSGQAIGATQDLLRGLNPKRGNKTPIRDLVSRYGNALAEVMPCFLMSPDSVASLVPVGAVNFDLVIFDEASQIRTSHAVGALGRGRAGIVVGDSRQMPPSSTFSSNAGAFVDADEDDEGDAARNVDDGESDDGLLIAVAARDAESILTEFEESEFPQRQLLCHYRSKDEVLISFSNSFIYGEPMLTFPSPAGLQSTALKFVHVADGVFERDKKAAPYQFGEGMPPVPALRTNFREAEMIVDEVIGRLQDPQRCARRAKDPDHVAESIIIVTFNVPQMNLITELFKHKDGDLFEQATVPRRLDDEAETEIPAQVKIRNLENVQGDEAETVIFSVAFSKTAAGKFPLNFGPVTRSGGERRLNVAVTRAQREMIVYASFLPDEMSQAGNTLGEEARLLQSFLKLAHRGPGASGDVGISVPRSRHIEHVASELKALGFEVQTQLGLSTLRVDLALRRPDVERWEIAVMVDDSCWSNRGSAFQREVLPRQMLPAMGWKRVYRIWLPAWKNSKNEILDEFRALLDGSLDDTPPVEEVVNDQVDSIESRVVADSVIDVTQEESNQEQPQRASVTATQPSSPTPVPSAQSSGFLTFTPFTGVGRGGAEVLNADPTDMNARQAILEVIDAVLATEAPIEVNRFGKTVCRAFGFNRVTPARVEQIVKMVPRGQVKKDSIGRFVWRVDSEWETWSSYRTSINEANRTVEEIPVVEYGNALIDFVEKAHSIGYEDAVREIARTFGIQRISASIRSVIEKALRETTKSGAVTLVDGVFHRS